jgi:hypothetical protein
MSLGSGHKTSIIRCISIFAFWALKKESVKLEADLGFDQCEWPCNLMLFDFSINDAGLLFASRHGDEEKNR